MADPVATSPIVGVVKPSKRASKSLDELRSMLPADIRIRARFAPVENGRLEEFETVLPAYRRYARELAEEGADIIHLEGTPPFLIIGWDAERKLICEWESEIGRPLFTSTMCQANALRALGVTRIVDAGYDPTTGPPVAAYFSAAGFDVLGVEKAPIDWGAPGALSDDETFSILRQILSRHPQAEALCLQGSSKWPLSSVVDRLEDEFGIVVVHPVAARFWELMTRLGRAATGAGPGRLLMTMPGLA